MTSNNRFHAALTHTACALSLFYVFGQVALAGPVSLDVSGMIVSSTVDGAPVGAGDYTLEQLMVSGTAVGSVTSDGLTGIPLWSLLGGNSAGSSDVVTSTPSGENSKNAILRSYVLATSVTGVQSIISIGEIDPFFGGTGAIPPFVAYSGTDGDAALIFPGSGASGRDVTDLASLQILSAPALVSGAGGVSTSLTLAGDVADPGNYNLADLQALTPVSETVGGDDYTGVLLWTLLSPTVANPLQGYVLAGGTDGYEVLYSLAELDPLFGAPDDLVPYADTLGQFPSDGLARIVIPGDNHAGRYVSNVDSIEVASVPEPGTFFTTALVVMLFVPGNRLRRRSEF